MKRFIIVQSDKQFYTSHSGLALVGWCVNELCSLPAKAREAFPISAENGIGLDDILRSYIGLLSMGKSDFEAVTNHREDDYFRESLGIGRVPSAETLRQRMDEVAAALRPLADGCTVEFLRKARVKITPLETGHIPLDCDVFPMDNSQTKKEGVSRIYNGQDGYAPMAAYLGREGWCLELELREGKQHSQSEFIPFLNRVLEKARSLTSRKLLVRLDSAHDALETRVALAGQRKVSYILKWNPRKEDQKAWARRIFKKGKVTTPRPGKRVGLLTIRTRQTHEGKRYRFKRVMRAVERTIDRHGQTLLMPEIELEAWWTTLDLPEGQVIRLYEDHGTSEQFHSEIKSDMDLERLPSGKFETNALILTLAGLAYNILRSMGQRALLDGRSPVRHPAKRRRIKTVMQELIYLAARLVKTGRRFKLIFSRHCP
ncbi:MAG: IS1380 family transposase, partial [Chloroflexi bacterium]|nr:IS1380 family transposase [Chloroflexota bacterium]